MPVHGLIEVTDKKANLFDPHATNKKMVFVDPEMDLAVLGINCVFG